MTPQASSWNWRIAHLETMAEPGPGNGEVGHRSPSPLLVDVPPQPGKGQVWRILAALAPVQAGDLSLEELLRRSRGTFSAGQTVLAITSDIGDGVRDWIGELLHLRQGGVPSSVLAVSPSSTLSYKMPEDAETGGESQSPSSHEDAVPQDILKEESESVPNAITHEAQANLADILARYEIPLRLMQAGAPLTPRIDVPPHANDSAYNTKRRGRCPSS